MALLKYLLWNGQADRQGTDTRQCVTDPEQAGLDAQGLQYNEHLTHQPTARAIHAITVKGTTKPPSAAVLQSLERPHGQTDVEGLQYS